MVQHPVMPSAAAQRCQHALTVSSTRATGQTVTAGGGSNANSMNDSSRRGNSMTNNSLMTTNSTITNSIMSNSSSMSNNNSSNKSTTRCNRNVNNNISSVRDSNTSSNHSTNSNHSIRSSPLLPLLAPLLLVLLLLSQAERAAGSVQVQQQLEEHQQQGIDSSSNGDGGGSSVAQQQAHQSPEGDDKTSSCGKRRLQECLALLQTLSTDHNLAFASNEAQLNEMCKTMRSGLRCVNDHVSQCFEAEHRRRIKQLLVGTQKTVQLLCNKGPLREKYLKHAPCMRNVSTDHRLCGGHYQDLITSVDPKDGLSSQDTIRNQCCAFHTYLACVGVAAEGRCGATAGKFVEDYSYRTAGPIILTRCRGYLPGSNMCTQTSGVAAVTSHPVYWLLLLPLLLTALTY